MDGSDGPVARAQDFQHGGFCWRRGQAITTVAPTTATTTTVTTVPKCQAGHMLDVRANECINCPAGQYQAQLNHQYGGCTKHAPCPRGEFISEEGTASAATKCTSHAECDGATQWESKAPTGSFSFRFYHRSCIAACSVRHGSCCVRTSAQFE